MEIKDDQWDALNQEFRERRQTLLNQLRQLDVWYEEQFVLLDITSTERR